MYWCHDITYLHTKRRYVCLFICLFVYLYVADGRPNDWADKTKLGMGTHVDPRSVLVKVKVIWRHLVNANKTPYRGVQGPREFDFEREAR